MDFKSLKLKIYQTPIPPKDGKEFEKVYEFWDGVWNAANVEIGRPTHLASDMLTRQHEILVLFDGDKPVALTCNRFVDFNLDSTLRDSYFLPDIWHKEDLEKLKALGGYGVVGNQITIDPNYRKTAMKSEFEMKALIVFLSLQRAFSFDIEMLVGMVRSDKGLDRLFYQTGAIPIVPMRKYKNIVVDLVVFRPDQKAIEIPANYQRLMDMLFAGAEIAIASHGPKKSIPLPMRKKKAA